MTICAVKWCHNTPGKQKKIHNITFHSFPSDPVVAARWAEIIKFSRNKETWKPTKNTRICSIHFDDKDLYWTNGGLRRVRRGAVPTKYLRTVCKEDNHNSCDDIEEFNPSPPPYLHVVCKEENQNSNDDVNDLSSTPLPYLRMDCKEEDQNSNDFVSELNPSVLPYLHIVCNEDNQESNDTNNPNTASTLLGTTSMETSQNHNLNSLTAPHQDFSDDDLDSIYDEPQVASLKKQLKKKNLLQVKHRKLIQTLQQNNRRLKKMNMSLKCTIENLEKKKYHESSNIEPKCDCRKSVQ